MKKSIISNQRERRRKRIRAKISGTSERPRLSIYKSNTAMYAQLIDDVNGTTLAASSSRGVKGNKTTAAKEAGAAIAKIAKTKNITTVVFDRGGFIFTGRVKALAEGAREGGLQF